MKKFLIETLGCKVNQYESASFRKELEEVGLVAISPPQQADIIIINSCAVTAHAGIQSQKTLRRTLRKHPKAKIIITGCLTEIDADTIANEPLLQGRRFQLIGNDHKDKIASTIINEAKKSDHLEPGTIGQAKTICRLPVKRFNKRCRAYLRVQDGCQSFCTYCIVPYTRGPSRSLPFSEVVSQAKIFAREGHKEIVLTGIHLGNYGKDLGENHNIISLISALSLETPDVSYRLSSLEPMEINRNLLELMATRNNIQPHLHIPLQSGNNEILTRMGRKYTTEQFKELIDLCRNILPLGAIGIDILVGFPGESDKHFNLCKTFLKSLDFTYLHVFPYSIRPGTVAAGFTDQIPKQIKEDRVRELRSLSDTKKRHFYSSQLGRKQNVLVEGTVDSTGRLKGFTDNYIAVRFDGPDSLLNTTTMVQLHSVENNFVLAKRVT